MESSTQLSGYDIKMYSVAAIQCHCAPAILPCACAWSARTSATGILDLQAFVILCATTLSAAHCSSSQRRLCCLISPTTRIHSTRQLADSVCFHRYGFTRFSSYTCTSQARLQQPTNINMPTNNKIRGEKPFQCRHFYFFLIFAFRVCSAVRNPSICCFTCRC